VKETVIVIIFTCELQYSVLTNLNDACKTWMYKIITSLMSLSDKLYALLQKHNFTGKARSDFNCSTSGQNYVFKCRPTYCKAGMKEGEVWIRKDRTHFSSYSWKIAVKIILYYVTITPHLIHSYFSILILVTGATIRFMFGFTWHSTIPKCYCECPWLNKVINFYMQLNKLVWEIYTSVFIYMCINQRYTTI
jgi:hypothetical protein